MEKIVEFVCAIISYTTGFIFLIVIIVLKGIEKKKNMTTATINK